MSETVQIDDLSIEIRRSTRRKHAALTIERDGSVVMAVPDTLPTDEITRIIRAKQVWIYTALDRKEETLKGSPAKEYVSGEGFFFLGRKYRLKVIRPDASKEAVENLTLKNETFFMPASLAQEGRQQFVRWYTAQAAEWIGKRLRAFKTRVAAEPKSLEIRDLGYRWASCTGKGKMFFHWRAILIPPAHLDYLILHELVHLHEHNHGPAFYERLHRACPDYKAHEDWLRRNGSLYTL